MTKSLPLWPFVLATTLLGSVLGKSARAQPQPIPVPGLVHPDSLAALIPSGLLALLPDSLQDQSPRYNAQVSVTRQRGREEVWSSASMSFRSIADATRSYWLYTLTLEAWAEPPDSLLRQRTAQPDAWEATTVGGYRVFRARSERYQRLEVWVTDRRRAVVHVPYPDAHPDSTTLPRLAETLALDELAALQAESVAWLDPYEREAYPTREAAQAAITERVVPVFVPKPRRLTGIFPDKIGDRYRYLRRGDVSHEVYESSTVADTVISVSEGVVRYDLEPPSSSFRGVGNALREPDPPVLRALAFNVVGVSHDVLWRELSKPGRPVRWREYAGIFADSTVHLAQCRTPAWLFRIAPTRFLCVEPNGVDSTLAFGLAAAADLEALAALPADTVGYVSSQTWGEDGFILPDGNGRRFRIATYEGSATQLTALLPPGRHYSDPRRARYGPGHFLVLADRPLDPSTDVFETDESAFAALLSYHVSGDLPSLLWEDSYSLKRHPLQRYGWIVEGEPRVARAPLRRAATYVPAVALTLRKDEQWAKLLVAVVGDAPLAFVGVGPSPAEARQRLTELVHALTYDKITP